MKVLIILNDNPYDGSDVAWNGLRLAEKLLDAGHEPRIFLMNDAVDLARVGVEPPEGYFDLGQMLIQLIARSVPVKACGTCNTRCGLHKGEPYFTEVANATMLELAGWIEQCERVITF